MSYQARPLFSGWSGGRDRRLDQITGGGEANSIGDFKSRMEDKISGAFERAAKTGSNGMWTFDGDKLVRA